MTIQLIADDGTTVMGTASVPAKTTQVLTAYFNNDPAQVLAGLLRGANDVIDRAVQSSPPADVQAATSAAAAAQASLATAEQSYRAVQN